MEELWERLPRLWHSQRLVYKAMVETDESKSLFLKLFSDPVVGNLASSPYIKPPSKADIDQTLSNMCTKDSLLSVLVCLPAKEDTGTQPPAAGEPIGFMELHKVMEGIGRIGLSILPEYQNKGYGRECLNWLIDWSFRWANLRKLLIGTVEYNERAKYLYTDVGFVQEARKRELVYLNMKYWDLIEYGMLFREWKALRNLEEGGVGGQGMTT